MASGLLIVLAAALATAVVSRFMWWACRRSALWRIFYGPLALVTVMCGGLYYKPGRVYSRR